MFALEIVGYSSFAMSLLFGLLALYFFNVESKEQQRYTALMQEKLESMRMPQEKLREKLEALELPQKLQSSKGKRQTHAQVIAQCLNLRKMTGRDYKIVISHCKSFEDLYFYDLVENSRIPQIKQTFERMLLNVEVIL